MSPRAPEIPEWKEARLGELLRERIRNGYSPVCPSEPTGKWILHLGSVTENGFNPKALKPAPADDPKVDSAMLAAGDVVVSRSNTRERVGFAGLYEGTPSPCAYPDLLMRVRPGSELDARFLLYALLSPRGRKYFEQSARGTSGSMVKIDRGLLEDFPLLLPPLPEQRKIAAILSSVDDTIEKTQAVIDQLEVVKKGLLGELLTRGIPGRHKEFRETPLGRIPAGWRLVTISNVGKVVTGSTPSTKNPSFWGGEMPFVTPGDLGGFRVVHSTERTVTDEGARTGRLLPAGAVLVTCIASIGKNGVAGSRCVTNQQINAIICNEDVVPEYVYYSVSHSEERLRAIAGATAVPIVSKGRFENFEVVLPLKAEQEQIVSVLSSVDDAIASNRRNVAQMVAMKAGLLGILISGQVRVSALVREMA